MYIHNEGDGTEELFDVRDDPRELLNRVRSESPASRITAIS